MPPHHHHQQQQQQQQQQHFCAPAALFGRTGTAGELAVVAPRVHDESLAQALVARPNI
ncbi:hypothetical protein MY1884_005799, partial [Beauveria asiatica]